MHGQGGLGFREGRQGALRGMRANGRKSEQGIEVEARQTAIVAAHAHVPFEQDGLAEQWQSNHQGGEQENERCRGRMEPHHPRDRRAKLAQRAYHLAAVPGQEPYPVKQMRAFGHARNGPTLEVAIPEARQLLQKRTAQPHFQASSGVPQRSRHRPFDQHHRAQKQQQRERRKQALLENREALANVESAAKEERLNHAADASNRQPGEDR